MCYNGWQGTAPNNVLFCLPYLLAAISHLTHGSKCQSLSKYITTDGQSASLSWCQAPMWGPWPYFYYYQTVADLLMWGALSDEGRVGSLELLLVLAGTAILGSESRRTHDRILLFNVWDSPVFISRRNMVAQLYPKPLGSLFVAIYYSRGYGGGILPASTRDGPKKGKVTLRVTVIQSVSMSWCRVPSGSHDQMFVTVWRLLSWLCGSPSLTRCRVCRSSFKICSI
jgi:hypothetical protein